jgi:phosphatidylglycerophosphate synthase
MSKVEKHDRENDILLGFLERPALKWLAEHMPAWVTPDILTWIGILGSLLIFISYILTHISPIFLWVASLGFILNWFGDSLDGTLARHRHIERPRYGFLVDHFVDALSTLFIFIGLGISPYVNLTVAAFGVIAYLLLSIMVYLITYVTGMFQITNAKIGPTEVRLLAILTNTVIFFIGNQQINLPIFGLTSYFTIIVGALSIAMFIYFIVNTTNQARKLALLDEKRLERRLDKEKKQAALDKLEQENKH